MSSKRSPRSMLWLSLAFAVACGPKEPPALVHPTPAATDIRPATETPATPLPPEKESLYTEAREVFEGRCVVCHGCYDAPCQLKLDAVGGMHRGASKKEVYHATRTRAVTPTRMGIDAVTIAQWRKLQFHPVVETDAQGAATPDSVMLRMLKLKRKHPLPPGKLLPKAITVALGREQVCATSDEMDDYETEHPLWGMPYGLPAITEAEQTRIERWLADGSPIPEPPALSTSAQSALERWEAFFNQETLKARLMSRYIYEHLFLATLTLEDTEDSEDTASFRLVRSYTPPGEPIMEIATRRPFDDPGDKPFYYRLRRRTHTTLSKTNMPYPLHDARMVRWRELFLDPAYEVDELPAYNREVAANPFEAFKDLPVRSRYAFMLDEAEFTLMGFIKGPVCRGQVALGVIQDQFWVTFVAPDSPLVEAEDDFLRENSAHLDLPASAGSNAMLMSWLRYSLNQRKFLKAKSRFLAKMAKTLEGPNLKYIWDGGGTNPNAALTVFRHFDSATVTKGLVGAPPKTAWVLSYSVLERIHYLLVAGFDVFGNVGHQLNTRMYMDFLRMEAEHNYLLFLPKKDRERLVDEWYRMVTPRVKNVVYGRIATFEPEPAIRYETDDAQGEFYGMLRAHLEPVLDDEYALEAVDRRVREALVRLQAIPGKAASHLPELLLLHVRDAPEGQQHYTLVRNSSHANVAYMFLEGIRRRPENDTLTVLPGFLGAYPNQLLTSVTSELGNLAARASTLDGPKAYEELLDEYGVRRTDPGFWEHSDQLRKARQSLKGAEAGLLDYSRLENR